MSIEAISWALNLAPIPTNRRDASSLAIVLVGLANHADPDGRNAFPAVATLVATPGYPNAPSATPSTRWKNSGSSPRPTRPSSPPTSNAPTAAPTAGTSPSPPTPLRHRHPPPAVPAPRPTRLSTTLSTGLSTSGTTRCSPCTPPRPTGCKHRPAGCKQRRHGVQPLHPNRPRTIPGTVPRTPPHEHRAATPGHPALPGPLRQVRRPTRRPRQRPHHLARDRPPALPGLSPLPPLDRREPCLSPARHSTHQPCQRASPRQHAPARCRHQSSVHPTRRQPGHRISQPGDATRYQPTPAPTGATHTSPQANDLNTASRPENPDPRPHHHRQPQRPTHTRPPHPLTPRRRHRPRRQNSPHQLAAERHQQTTTADTAARHQPDPTSRAALALVATNPGDTTHQPPPPRSPTPTTPLATTPPTSRTPLALVTTNPANPPTPTTSWRALHTSAASTGGQLASRTASTGEPDHQPAPGGGRLVAWTGFLFGSITSIAANVLHAWLPAAHQPPGWTPALAPQIGAAVWPIGLMIAIEAVTRIRWPEGFCWSLARFGGAGTVALGSAVISYGHLRDILVAWQYTSLAAAVGPLVLAGLMVVCGFALLASSHTTQGQTPPDDHR